MRLLMVTHFFESHRGGIEIVAGKLARELMRRGHTVTWAAADVDNPPGSEVAAAVPLRTFNLIERLSGLPMPIPSPGALRRLARAVTESDVVIVHDGLYATSIAALLIAKLKSRPVVITQHIGRIPFSSRLLAALMQIADRVATRPMLAAAEQVVFISETIAGQYRPVRFRRPPILAFNGVDTDRFVPAHADQRAAARARFGFSRDEPVLLFVGRFVEKKGLAVLREIASARPDLGFALAGWGPIDPCTWALPNVRVFGGLAGEDLADLYRAADAFLLPSVGEGFPLVVQEALASDLPILCGSETATAHAAAASLLASEPVDLSDPGGTATRFVAKLDRLLSEPRDGRRSAFARNHYSWDATGSTYDRIVRALSRVTGTGRESSIGTA